MTDLGTRDVAWMWLEDSELCAGSQLKPFGHAMAWNAFNTDQSRIRFFRQHTLNLTHPKSDATHYGNVRHTAAKYNTPCSTHLGGKCKGDRLQFSEQVIIIERKKFILQGVNRELANSNAPNNYSVTLIPS
jgi:hypothetical protein